MSSHICSSSHVIYKQAMSHMCMSRDTHIKESCFFTTGDQSWAYSPAGFLGIHTLYLTHTHTRQKRLTYVAKETHVCSKRDACNLQKRPMYVAKKTHTNRDAHMNHKRHEFSSSFPRYTHSLSHTHMHTHIYTQSHEHTHTHMHTYTH